MLREGPESPYARWFDIDWAAGDGRMLLPVLGGRIGDEMDGMRVDGEVLRYGEQEFLPGPAPPTFRCRSCWTPSTTGSAGGGWPAPS